MRRRAGSDKPAVPTFVPRRHDRTTHNCSVVLWDIALTRVDNNLLLYQCAFGQLGDNKEHGRNVNVLKAN